MNVRSYYLGLGTALAILSLAATTARADQLKLTSSTYSNGGSGGAYTAQILSGPATNAGYTGPNGAFAKNVSLTNSFETFCLEPTEYFNSGYTYDYTIAGYAFGGANEASGRNSTIGDQLSLGTTWLYSQYVRGMLAASAYNSGTRQASNLLLQRAFWYLEDDYTATGYNTAVNALATNGYLTLVANLYGGGTAGLALARNDALTGANGVFALNISSTSGNVTTQKQSQLYYQPVPDASTTVTLLGLGIMGIVALRRKFGIAK